MSAPLPSSLKCSARTGCGTSPTKWIRRTGLIWVYSPGDDGVMAFTDFGIETLTGLIEIYKADPDLLKRSSDPK